MLDKLFINGEIYSMKKEGEKFQSLGVKDGKITFLGTDEEAKNLNSKELIDLKGKMMIPGMADAHLHLYAYCQNLTFVDLSKVHDINEMISLMKEKVKNSQLKAAVKVNYELLDLYWNLGKEITEKQVKYSWGKAFIQNI